MSFHFQEPKKNVSFKTQHYHCVYEYPRDPSECKPNHKPHNSFPDFVPNYNQPSDFGANYNQPSDLGANYGHPLDLVKFSDDGEFFIRSSMKPLQRPSSEFYAGDPYNFFFQRKWLWIYIRTCASAHTILVQTLNRPTERLCKLVQLLIWQCTKCNMFVMPFHLVN